MSLVTGLRCHKKGMHGAGASRVEQCGGIAAVHCTNRIVGVLPRRAGKNSPASFDFNKLEIQRYQNARLTAGSHQGAQLRQTIEATSDLIHETHACSSKQPRV